MSKAKTVFFCNNCGNESAKWVGKCPSCGAWNSYVEERAVSKKSGKGSSSGGGRELYSLSSADSKPVKVSDIETVNQQRIILPSSELNRVLGGGLVLGSIVLLGGEPGIGKSTLALQNMLRIRSRKVLYVSGEESAQQIKLRADRIGGETGECYIVCETSLERIFDYINELSPDIVVVDSIQTVATESMESSAGSVGQVRECAAILLKYAKETNTPVVLIGHINKEGSIAGPKILEHIVDAVIQFEGDRHYMYRIIRSIKNRFGSTSELGIYQMDNSGLREVKNPSEMLISNYDESLSGVAIGVSMEGIRSLMIETQALVTNASYGVPQRSVTGFDAKRMSMLLAVLEKRVGFKLAQKDVFLNIAGGIKVNDPALDMAIVASIISSNIDVAIPKGVCMAGEVGLSGEIRQITRIDSRIMEAEKLGFKRIVIPKNNLKGINQEKFNIQIIEVAKVEELAQILFR
ncbi:MAG: DNA repair protein RadA [Bacteroidales bacterium]